MDNQAIGSNNSNESYIQKLLNFRYDEKTESIEEFEERAKLAYKDLSDAQANHLFGFASPGDLSRESTLQELSKVDLRDLLRAANQISNEFYSVTGKSINDYENIKENPALESRLQEEADKSVAKASSAIEHESERLKFESTKKEYEMYQSYLAMAEKEFQKATKNLAKAKPGPARDLAFQEMMGVKNSIDNLNKQIERLQMGNQELEKLSDQEERSISLVVQQTQEKIGKAPELVMEKISNAKDQVSELSGKVGNKAKEISNDWKEHMMNAINDTRADFKKVYNDTLNRAAATISLITDNVKQANETFKTMGAAAYVGVGVKARDLTVAFTEKSINEEKAIIEKATKRLDHVNEIIDKANRIKTTGHQFKNAWRSLFGMKEQSPKDDISKDNFITQKLQQNITASKEHLQSLEQQLPELKNLAYQSRMNLINVRAKLQRDTKSQDTPTKTEPSRTEREIPMQEQTSHHYTMQFDEPDLLSQINDALALGPTGLSITSMPQTLEDQIEAAKESLRADNTEHDFEEKEQDNFFR